MVADESHDDRTRSFISLIAGTRVSHYEIIQKIGSGGMGDVYLALDTRLNRKVALKFLPPHLCQDEDCRKRFTREAQAAAGLDHPNIAGIYEVGDYSGRPFYSMQIVEGRSLREVIGGKDLPIERIIEIAIQVCEGLQAAHDKGIIHRDIKPSNILLDGHGRIRIVDFGLASVRGSEHLTKTGSTLGTIGYMSPEMVRGKEIDSRSDLFSLGVVMYELITRQNPFRRDNEAATLKAVIDETPDPVARFRAGLVDEIQSIIDKALDKDAKTRYQHADGMLADLVRIKRSLDAGQTAKTGISKRKQPRKYLLTAAVISVLAATVLIVTEPWVYITRSERPARIMLAVLPFENLGNPQDEYFADGITEEITTSLARLSGLGVISRSSAILYKDTDKSLRQIGKELKVDCVLEGTIRWDKSGPTERVRINPQLVRVSDDMNVWANRYDAVLTDVFAVQATIAREVAEALDIALLQTEREALEKRPDISSEAYDFYLRGKQYFSIARYRQDELPTAERMHIRAIALAPKFAPAYAELGALYTELHWDGIDTSETILDSSRALIDRALFLAPDSPEPYQALGWYYYHGLRDYDRALEAFSEVLQRQPNNSMAIASIAWVQRRQGKWGQATDGLLRAVKLAPREPWYYHELGNTYLSSRRFERAIECYDQAIDLDPHNAWSFFGKSWAVLNISGDPEAALDVIATGLEFDHRSPFLTYLAAYCHLCNAEYEQALSLMTGPRDIILWQTADGVDYYYLKGRTYLLLQQDELAHFILDSACVIMEDVVAGDPANAANQACLGKIYAALGRSKDAIAAARRGVELLPINVDALDGDDLIWDLATVYASVGEYDMAIDQLDTLLRVPSQLSVNWLKIAPEFLSLHDHPRFRTLLELYKGVEGRVPSGPGESR